MIFPILLAAALVPKHDKPPAAGAPIAETFLWCDKGGCRCFEPRGCDPAAANGCSTIDGHLAEIDKIVSGKKKGITLECLYAETGTCGDWKYIYCDIGEMGTRLRFFDAKGVFAAARWSSDYDEFCGGKALVTYQGQIPACKELKRTKVLFGKSGQTPQAPAAEPWVPK